MKYEVVCSEGYFDVGLLVELCGTDPKKILSRKSTCSESCYGGIEKIIWIHTGVFLSVEEWNKITLDKTTDQILQELNIAKNKIVEPIHKNADMKSISWYQLWERIGRQPLYKTKNTMVKVLTHGELKECASIFTDDSNNFYLEILE